MKLKKVFKSKVAGYSQLLSKRFDQFSYDHWPRSYLKAKDSMILSKNGVWYLDMSISGIGACVLGYSNEDIDKSVIEVIKNGVASSVNSELEESLALKLLNYCPEHNLVRFCKSGGEAVSIAVRVCRGYTGKSKILFSGYHGWSDWYLAANLGDINNLNNHLLRSLEPFGVPKELCGTSEPFDCENLSDLEQKIIKSEIPIGGIVMEPARSKEADRTLLLEIKKIAQKFSIPLVFDEISSGFRHTKGPYSQTLGITPDIYVFAKSIGNGYPIAAITGTHDIMSCFNKSFVSSTNWTEATGLGAACAVLDYMNKHSTHTYITELGNYWEQSIKSLSKNLSFEINTSGLPGMKYFNHPEAPDIFRTFFTVFSLEKELLVAGRYYPNFKQTKKNIDFYMTVLEDCIRKYKTLSRHEVESFCGRIMPTGFNILDQK